VPVVRGGRALLRKRGSLAAAGLDEARWRAEWEAARLFLTAVLLGSGKAVPISSLVPGEKVLATSIRTGKAQAETIAAVLVHHDTNLYDLTVRANGRMAVIGTTSNHPFWDATTRRWVKAAALRYGTHLRTPGKSTVAVTYGLSSRARSGWMWDLTVTGDHDFYVMAGSPVLVHNCPMGPEEGASGHRRDQAATRRPGPPTRRAGPSSPTHRTAARERVTAASKHASVVPVTGRASPNSVTHRHIRRGTARTEPRPEITHSAHVST
jgi:hypothetical protein